MYEYIKTSHKGYEIQFNETNETWECKALSIEKQKLAWVKKEIDQHDTDTRRVKKVPCLRFDVTGHGDARKGRRGHITILDGASAWVVWDGKPAGSWDKMREKVELKHLLADTPENLEKIAEIKKLDTEGDRLKRNAREIQDNHLVRLTSELVQSLSADIADAEAAE